MKNKIIAMPYIIWSVIFIAIPLGLIIFFAFTDTSGDFTMSNISYAGRFSGVLIKSIWLALISTVICIIIGYPLAYLMSRMDKINTRILLMFLILPMWMNFLLRTYAWMTLLENKGIINQFIMALGFEPISIINTQGAVILGMVYNYIPFMILPLHAVMVKIKNDIIEVAGDLGAGPKDVFLKIVFPLSKPGVKIGAIMVFVPSVSTFIISQMLGGGRNQLIGDIIEMQFLGNAYNPQLGSAIALVLMVLVMLNLSITGVLDDRDVEEPLV